MITAEGKAICDKEIGSPKRGWRGCRRPAHHYIASQHVQSMTLHYCNRHFKPGPTVECWNCDGEIYIDHDCGEDTCCCADPELNVICDVCNGKGYLPSANEGEIR